MPKAKAKPRRLIDQTKELIPYAESVWPRLANTFVAIDDVEGNRRVGTFVEWKQSRHKEPRDIAVLVEAGTNHRVLIYMEDIAKIYAAPMGYRVAS